MVMEGIGLPVQISPVFFDTYEADRVSSVSSLIHGKRDGLQIFQIIRSVKATNNVSRKSV